jgi:hypothetical protein
VWDLKTVCDLKKKNSEREDITKKNSRNTERKK